MLLCDKYMRRRSSFFFGFGFGDKTLPPLNAILYLLNCNCSDEVHLMGVIQKKCSVCGKVFTTLDNKNKYCSAQCAKKANKKK
jgi:hypothetical protein